MSTIAISLSKLKQLEELKILFDASSYSGEHVFELGEALK